MLFYSPRSWVQKGMLSTVSLRHIASRLLYLSTATYHNTLIGWSIGWLVDWSLFKANIGYFLLKCKL